ncbi:hypothetical protein NDU88_003042 [Pleurodeles waltl]|uniref:Uncharacterized protein n=1 Tax=Pleurodeles waltl TaxID=8319 RepID=A0AAV7LE37_PLEWA|nr:hypothetical protein NDU88_003042 [Pleurodeles waltl]
MEAHRSKKDITLKDMLTKPAAQKPYQLWDALPNQLASWEAIDVDHLEGKVTITRSFKKTLFGTLWRDIVSVREEVAAVIKEIKKDVREIGPLEQASDAREQELD